MERRMDETSKSAESTSSAFERRPSVGRVALVWRGEPGASVPEPGKTRFHLIFSALDALGVAAEPALYSEEAEEALRARLLEMDGVLVWVDPLSAGKNRSRLDPLLRDLAAKGVWVSTHPDVILKMGVKEVLYRTRHLGWGTDTHFYRDVVAVREEFPQRLRTASRLDFKQNSSIGGEGVWKVDFASGHHGTIVRLLHAPRGSVPQEM